MSEACLVITDKHLQYDGDFSNFHLDSLMSDCYISMGYSNEEFNKSWDYYTTDAKMSY